MDFETKSIDMFCGKLRLGVPADVVSQISTLQSLANSGKSLHVSIKEKREHRSLDANAALWKMIDSIAKALESTKDEIYLLMLERYGVFTHVVVHPAAVNRVISNWKTARILGDVTVNGKKGVQLQCFFGSSTYNTKEFSKLLEGVISEAKDLGIEFISAKDKEKMLEEWGK